MVQLSHRNEMLEHWHKIAAWVEISLRFIDETKTGTYVCGGNALSMNTTPTQWQMLQIKSYKGIKQNK